MDLGDITRELGRVEARGFPPVEKWDPPSCGDIGMRIARDGTWYYQNSPIGRAKLVRLFSTILRRDADGQHYLVTPVEKVPVEVEDTPFIAIAMTRAGAEKDQRLTFRTNLGDEACASTEHPMRCVIAPDTQEPSPYIHIRGRLEARIARAVFYDLVNLGTEADVNGARFFGVWSAGVFFPFERAEAL